MSKLLTIAIPSYNRCGILSKSLSILAPQVREYLDDIEVVLSDDGSTDDTFAVMQMFHRDNPDLDIVINRQPQNTGFYGNFKKCREMSSGKFLWILSDNEHLLPLCISRIVSSLEKHRYIGGLFLNNKRWFDGRYKDEAFLNLKTLVESGNSYKITLTSNFIMRNEKEWDNELFARYENNIFLGFILAIAGLRARQAILELRGRFHESIPCNPWGGFAYAFSDHINKPLGYAMLNDVMSLDVRNNFVDGLLKSVIYDRVLDARIAGDSVKDFTVLDKYYYDRPFYVNKIRPLLCAGIIAITYLRIIRFIKGVVLHKKIAKRLHLAF